MEGQLRTIRSILIGHERKLNILFDRASYVFVVMDDKTKQLVADKREEWRKAEKERVEKDKKAKGKGKGEGAEKGKETKQEEPFEGFTKHPMGSLRSIMFKTMLDKINETENQEVKDAVVQLSKMDADSFAFRFRAKHEESVQDRPWVWELTLCENAFAEVRKLLEALRDKDRKAPIKVLPMHSQDHPSITALIQEAKGGGKKSSGKGGKNGKGKSGNTSWNSGNGGSSSSSGYQGGGGSSSWKNNSWEEDDYSGYGTKRGRHNW
eukprot:TRINITY_DN105721_c0_g1_i1.p1 TRINITY_DN105721_c0_g1~~TRINITY_DN105721_c0_g1_i1.p1  ORF type:complete len:291 (+),score=73.80 TRINITY_DN105721_c0_g1_i1:80-874(+)